MGATSISFEIFRMKAILDPHKTNKTSNGWKVLFQLNITRKHIKKNNCKN